MELPVPLVALLALPYAAAAAAALWWLASAPRGGADADPLVARKYSVEVEGDFVVFVIGIYFHPRSFWRQWPMVLRAGAAMDAMKRELESNPDLGCMLVSHTATPPLLGPNPTRLVQIWRSYDHLAAYARSRMSKHLGTWLMWDAHAKQFKGKEVPGLGIYHEAYLLGAGQYEAIYRNMPRTGLARIGRVVDASEGRHRTGKGRLGQSDGSDHAGVY